MVGGEGQWGGGGVGLGGDEVGDGGSGEVGEGDGLGLVGDVVEAENGVAGGVGGAEDGHDVGVEGEDLLGGLGVEGGLLGADGEQVAILAEDLVTTVVGIGELVIEGGGVAFLAVDGAEPAGFLYPLWPAL